MQSNRRLLATVPSVVETLLESDDVRKIAMAARDRHAPSLTPTLCDEQNITYDLLNARVDAQRQRASPSLNSSPRFWLRPFRPDTGVPFSTHEVFIVRTTAE